jgi:hypothetical protein
MENKRNKNKLDELEFELLFESHFSNSMKHERGSA